MMLVRCPACGASAEPAAEGFARFRAVHITRAPCSCSIAAPRSRASIGSCRRAIESEPSK
jgi:hypothetical protein